MSILISNEILATARMTEAEMRQEIAILLFQKEKFTLAQASRFAGVHRMAFQHILATCQIPVHYGVDDFEHDVRHLQELGRL